MKQFILSLCILSFSISEAYSQQYIYDGLNFGPNSFFPFSQLNDWGSAYGRVEYSPTLLKTRSAIGYGSYPGGASYIGPLGSGIFRNFDFKKNTDYIIKIGIDTFSLKAKNSTFIIKLANDVVASWSSSSSIPVAFPNSREVYRHPYVDGQSELGNVTLNLRFSTGPNESFSSLVIFPASGAGQGLECILRITCLEIQGCTHNENMYYDDDEIPSGFLYQQNAFVGSSYNIISNFTRSRTDRSTTIRSRDKVVILENTELSITEPHNSITLEIAENPCIPFNNDLDQDEVVASFEPGGCGYGDRSSDIDEEGQPHFSITSDNSVKPVTTHRVLTEPVVTITPNPTSDIVYVKIPQTQDALSVILTKMNGVILQDFKAVYSDQKISMEQYPDGLYLLRVQGKNINIVKKIIKMQK